MPAQWFASKSRYLLKIMKTFHSISVVAIALFAVVSCDKPAPDFSKKIAELEQKNTEAAERQQQLEQKIQDQQLAVEHDAIERERIKIEEERADLEHQQSQAATEKEEAIRKREEDLAHREGKLEQFQSALNEKQDDLNEKSVSLNDRDRDLAGREALPFKEAENREPVADYSMFYDSLSSHGSWFETADYGYVWQPVAVRDSNWRPYSRGRWICSDRGWNWVSEEPFGWATYHYGRWALLRGRGWIWVPGSEWAPSWVSWRENDSHIGWAPLPPETLAYRGHAWDSTVDVQFGIGASWFNFVEIRNFGGPLYGHCLPVNGNGTLIIHTTNITHIHIENRQVICGGPRYRQLSDRIGKPLPFYRLEIDQRPGGGRGSSGMRTHVKGDRMVVSAPNVNADWNDGLKPGRVIGRMEAVTVEREQGLSNEITNRFRQSRRDNRTQAEKTIGKLGGPEKFDQRRQEQLQKNRRVVDPSGRTDIGQAVLATPDRAQREIPANRGPGQENQPNNPAHTDDRRNPERGENPRVTPPADVKPRPDPRPQRQIETLPTPQKNDRAREENDRRQPQQQDDTRRGEQRRRTEQAQEAEQGAVNRRQLEQNQQQQKETQRREQQTRQQQQETQRQEQETQQQRQETQRQEQQTQQQQQEIQRREQETRQQQQEIQSREKETQQQQQETQRQDQQARQQRQQETQRQEQQAQQQQQQETQRQEQQARQQQQETQRQEQRTRQQQEENQRQQEQGRQQQQENQRQKRQEESRQQPDKDSDGQRKRNR